MVNSQVSETATRLAIHCSLFTTHYSLLTIHYSLFTVHWVRDALEPAEEGAHGGHVNRHAVPVRDRQPGDGGHFPAWQDNAHQIQRIGGGHHNHFAVFWSAPDRSERLNGFRQRELLADKSRHETAPADLTRSLPAAVDSQQDAPAGRQRLPGHEIAEHHAISPQQLAGDGFITAMGFDVGRPLPQRPPPHRQRPPVCAESSAIRSGSGAAVRSEAPPVAMPPAPMQQLPQPGHTITAYHAVSDQFP